MTTSTTTSTPTFEREVFLIGTGKWYEVSNSPAGKLSVIKVNHHDAYSSDELPSGETVPLVPTVTITIPKMDRTNSVEVVSTETGIEYRKEERGN